MLHCIATFTRDPLLLSTLLQPCTSFYSLRCLAEFFFVSVHNAVTLEETMYLGTLVEKKCPSLWRALTWCKVPTWHLPDVRHLSFTLLARFSLLSYSMLQIVKHRPSNINPVCRCWSTISPQSYFPSCSPTMRLTQTSIANYGFLIQKCSKIGDKPTHLRKLQMVRELDSL